MRTQLDYIPGEVNQICIVIEDTYFPDKKYLPVVIKDEAMINAFYEEFNAVVKKHFFQIDAHGSKESMVDRFHKKQQDEEGKQPT